MNENEVEEIPETGSRQPIGHIRVPPEPLYQNEVKCSAFDMEKVFHSCAYKTHFHEKGCALGLILKVRVLELGSGLLKTRVLKVRANRRSCL